MGKHKLNGTDISVDQLLRHLWNKRKLVYKFILVFCVIGIVIALTSDVEYKASCKLLPESQESGIPNMGALGGLAGLAGIDLSSMSTSDALPPQLYPEIAQSLPFIIELMNDSIEFEQEGIYSNSLNYFKEISQNKLLSKLSLYLSSFFRELNDEKPHNFSYYRFSEKEWNAVEKFKERIHVDLSEQTGILTIEVKMPDPLASAQLTDLVEKRLTMMIIKYKTDNAVRNLTFIQNAYDTARLEFESLQYRLAHAIDRNKNITSSRAQIEVNRIENEYNLVFEVYKSLASQLEQAKVTLNERTPVFTVLEPVRIPEVKSEPRRLVILVISMVLGFILSLVIILGRLFILEPFYRD